MLKGTGMKVTQACRRSYLCLCLVAFVALALAADLFAEYPEGTVMHSFSSAGRVVVPWTPPMALREEPAPESPGTHRAQESARHYFRQVLALHMLPPDLEKRLVLRRIVFADHTYDVIDLRYRLGDLALWARQDASTLQIMVQVVGLDPIEVSALPEEEYNRAMRERDWVGWRKPEHDRMLDLMLFLAETLFVPEDDLPKEINVRGKPWPAWRAGGIRTRLWGTEGVGYGKYARVPNVFEGEPWPGGVAPPSYRSYEETGKRLFLEFLAWTDGQTVTFMFPKSTGTPLGSAAAAEWFSEDPNRWYQARPEDMVPPGPHKHQ